MINNNPGIYNQINEHYSDAYKNYAKLVDYDGDMDFKEMEKVWDVLIANINNGLEIPPQSNKLFEQLQEVDTLWWFFY